MRIILGVAPRTSADDMLEKLNWMSIKQRLFFNNMSLMWRIVHNNVPNYLLKNVKYAHEQHGHQTRGATHTNIFIDRRHKFSLFQQGALDWNGLPYEIRDIAEFHVFKRNLSRFILCKCERF
jgi:hypothetical protein